MGNALSYIFVKLCEIEISSIFDCENAYPSIVCKLEFVGISTFLNLWQLENAYSHIFVTLAGIEISSMFEYENAYGPMILIFCGIEISLISRRTNSYFCQSNIYLL